MKGYPTNSLELKLFLLEAVMKTLPPSTNNMVQIKKSVQELYDFMGGDDFENPNQPILAEIMQLMPMFMGILEACQPTDSSSSISESDVVVEKIDDKGTKNSK